MGKIRESNIELLRITLMLMIISHHIIVHGFGLKNMIEPGFEVKSSTYIEIILNSFFVIAVNSFVFISGYFGIKFNLKKIAAIIIQAVSYSVIFYLAFLSVNKTGFHFISFAKSFFPISNNTWWFITTYIGLYFLSPFLNAGIKSSDKTELFYVLTGLFILNCISSFIFGGISKNGYELFNFIFIYLTGRFIRLNELTIKKPGVIIAICSLIISLAGIFLGYVDKSKLVWHIFYYNNPILILSAISLFFLFYNSKVEYNKWINSISATILGVYMIHDYPRIRDFIAKIVALLSNYSNDSIAVLSLSIIALIAIIFLVSSAIEYIRMKIYDFINEKFRIYPVVENFTSKLKAAANLQFNKWRQV